MTGTERQVCPRCGTRWRDDAALSVHEFLRHGVFPEGSEERERGESPQVMTCRRCGEEHGAHDLAVEVHRQLRHPRPRPKPRPDDEAEPHVPPMRFGGHRFGGRSTPPRLDPDLEGLNPDD